MGFLDLILQGFFNGLGYLLMMYVFEKYVKPSMNRGKVSDLKARINKSANKLGELLNFGDGK